jgi:hypothetical protein
VLAASHNSVEPDFDSLNSTAAQGAARFWAGKWTGSQAKALCIERLKSAWCDPKRVAEVVATLRPEQRAVLAVVRRYGGAISGSLLRQELLARGIVKEPKREDLLSYRRETDPVHELCENLVLLGGYRDSWSFGHSREYSSVSLPSRLASHIKPAASLDWKASAPLDKAPESTAYRAPAQVLIDIEQTARGLQAQGRWKVNQGGALPAAVRNRLAKLLPPQSGDPLEPPDRVVLDYTLLCAMGVAEFDEVEGWFIPEQVEALANLSPEAQSSRYVRAWLTLRTWQDGTGAVPDRDNREESTRIDPSSMRKARDLLVWALARIAHSKVEWLDLETFLLDLYKVTGENGLSFYWHKYAWQPRFATAEGKDKLPGGFERSRAYWMDDEGIWAANALLSTMVHLGVVERGHRGGVRSERWCFRLTEVGKAVFGAPEVRLEKATGDEKCLTVQPNHEILLYLDTADGPTVTTLGRIASRESATGVVQNFKLTRDSVYAALEGGMALAEIESFLAHSLAEWSRKREAIVVRSSVALAAGLPDGQSSVRGRSVGKSFVVASSRAAGKAAKDLGIAVESEAMSRDWKVDEHGTVSLGKTVSLVGKARLQRFAEPSDGKWRITAESVRAARELGVSSDQILGWLTAHVSHEVSPVLATAIRNWAGGRDKAFLDGVVLLQINDPKAFEALRRSERIRPFLKGVLSPGSFVVTEEGRKEATKLLRDLGFSLDVECKLASLDDG